MNAEAGSEPEMVTASEDDSVNELQSGSDSDFEMVMSEDGADNNGEEDDAGDNYSNSNDAEEVVDLANVDSDSDDLLDVSSESEGEHGMPAMVESTSDSESDGWSDVSEQSSGSSGVDVGEAMGSQCNILMAGGDSSLPIATCYPIPTTVHHIQTADSLQVSTSGPGSDGEVEVVVHAALSLEVWRLRESQATRLSSTEWPLESYSLQISPDNCVVVTGGPQGWVHVYVRLPTGSQPAAAADLQPKWAIRIPGDFANCVRMGRVGSRDRLVVAGQDGHVYFFNIPAPSSDSPTCMLCRAVEEPPGTGQPQPAAPPMDTKPVYLYRCDTGGEHVPMMIGQALEHTAVVGRWDYAVNCAEPSPDGQWLAVVGDDLELWLLSADTNFRKSAGICLPLNPNWAYQSRLQTGCQYCAWSPCGTRIAVSSDTAKCVIVWDVASREQTHRLRFARMCLAVTFASWDADILFCGESHKYIHAIMLLPEGKHVGQQVKVPSERRVAKIHGLATDRHSKLLCATQSLVVQWNVLREWSTHLHYSFPSSFKAAAKAVLMAALVDANGEPRHPTGAARGFWSLPSGVLLHIIGRSACPLQPWAMHHVAHRSR